MKKSDFKRGVQAAIIIIVAAEITKIIRKIFENGNKRQSNNKTK